MGGPEAKPGLSIGLQDRTHRGIWLFLPGHSLSVHPHRASGPRRHPAAAQSCPLGLPAWGYTLRPVPRRQALLPLVPGIPAGASSTFPPPRPGARTSQDANLGDSSLLPNALAQVLPQQLLRWLQPWWPCGLRAPLSQHLCPLFGTGDTCQPPNTSWLWAAPPLPRHMCCSRGLCLPTALHSGPETLFHTPFPGHARCLQGHLRQSCCALPEAALAQWKQPRGPVRARDVSSEPFKTALPEDRTIPAYSKVLLPKPSSQLLKPSDNEGGLQGSPQPALPTSSLPPREGRACMGGWTGDLTTTTIGLFPWEV